MLGPCIIGAVIAELELFESSTLHLALVLYALSTSAHVSIFLRVLNAHSHAASHFDSLSFESRGNEGTQSNCSSWLVPGKTASCWSLFFGHGSIESVFCWSSATPCCHEMPGECRVRFLLKK